MPIWKVPGFAFSCSTSSPIELTGTLMLPTSADGTSAMSETGVFPERIVGELAVEKRIHDERAVDRHQQRVAIGRGLGDGLGADDGVGARPVVDDDLLAQIFAHLLAHEAAEKIGGAARRERNDERDLARRIGLGDRCRNEERQ